MGSLQNVSSDLFIASSFLIKPSHQNQMAQELLEQSLKERFEHINWSVYLYNSSLSELQIISDYVYNSSELQIVNSSTFNFYRVTLQYCFIMEYNKLLEKGSKDNKQNISSLQKLNETIFSLKGNSFKNRFLENEEKLLNLKKSDFYEKLKKLRDKKFAHADHHDINVPYKINGFNSDELKEGFLHLQVIKEILINCTTIFDFECRIQIPNDDDRTENFIRDQAEYADYYFSNFWQNNKKI
jgi:hypothetical protein